MRDSDRGTILDSEGPDILRSSLLNSGSLPPHSFQDQNARKILVVGFTGTGKSSFVIKSLYDFTDLEGIGNEEIHFGRFEYKKKDYNLQIVDVASLDNYTPLLPTKYTLKVDGYVFVYAVDDEATFQFIQVLKDRLYNLSGKMIPAVLVANKCDRTATRAVTTKQGSKLAKGYKIPYFEISATQNSKEVTRKVFEEMLKEILKSEAQINTLKWLKNWERSRVDDLRKIFFLALILTGIIGLFCFSFPIINMFLYPTLMQVQGIVLILLISEGIISVALSIIGWIGMQKEKDDYIRAFTVLVVFSTAIDIALIVLKIAHPVPSVEQLKSDNPQAGAEYNLLDPVVFVVLAMIWAVMVFLFVIARISKEIFLKRRNANKSKFATLRV